MKLVAGLFWTIAVFAVLGAVISWSPVSSDSPKSPTQTPSIKTEKQVEDSSKGENQTDAHAKYGSVSSERLNASGAATEGHEQPEKRTEKTSEFWTIGSRTLKITDTLLVVFTFFLFLATVALWRATRDLVDDAKETSERQLRAYVYLEMSAFQWPFPPKNSDRWGIVVKITNSGQTWARNVVIRRAKISKEKGDLTDPWDDTEWRRPTPEPMVLGPKQSVPLQMGDISFTDAPSIINGDRIIYFVVWVTYEDVAGPKPTVRHTQVSVRFNADAEGGTSFSFLPTHNCADDSCPKK
jgi:hypothetical protein